MEGVVDAFLGRVRVQPVRNSRLVSVSFESFRPELAAQAANALSKAYIQQALDLRSGTSAEAGEWLGTQIAEQRKKVDELSARMRSVEHTDGIVNVAERRTLLDQRLKELGSSLNDRKTERLQKEALWGQMRSAPNPEELPEAMRSPMVQSLRLNLADLERKRAELLERYMEQHPEVVKVKTEIGEARARIRAEAQRIIRAAENDYKAAAAQEASVSRALETAKAEADDLAQRSGPYDSQKRELDAALQVLQSVLARNKETDVTQELKSSNIRIVDAAVVPQGPIRPQKRRDIGFGLLLGAVLSVGLAFFLDYLDNTLKTPDDVRNHLGVPLLGVIPDAGENRVGGMLVTSLKSRDDPFVEGFRVLRTALEYSWPETTPRILLVTSTAPGEGKTITALNLALTLASLDQRVLLIDADLRKPKTHSVLKLKRTPGLTDVLVGRAQPSVAIQQRVHNTRLDLLPAGTSVPSPADLLSGQAMPGLLEALRTHYRWIVIDTPPVGAVAEPLALAPMVDGMVVVAGAEMVPRKAVAHSLERLAATRGRILGVVLNRAQVQKHSYYYGHYYGYYGGDYGAEERFASSGKVASISAKRARG
jgi:succinoglycan biosynthesis transport protein ExoP